MRPLTLILALATVPAVTLGPTAGFAQQADLGVPLNSVQFGGGELFVVPGWTGDGVAPGGTSGEESDRILGGFSFGASLFSRIGEIGETPLYIGWTGSILVGVGTTRDTTTYSGNAPVLVTGASAPTSGTIDLTTGTGAATASGTVSLTDSSGDTGTVTSSASSPPGDNATAQYSVTTTETGAAILALTTDGTGPDASAFSVLADENGFALIGTGDLEDTEVTSRISETLVMANQKVMLSAPISLEDGWSITPALGPSYNLLVRSVHQETLVDVTEPAGLADDTIPLFGIAHDDDLTAHYVGGIIGASLSGPVAEGWRFSVGTELGVSQYWADYEGTSSAVFSRVDDVALPGTSQSISGTTLYNRVSGGLSYLGPDGLIVSLGVHVERLGDVPYIQTTAVGSADADFNAGNSEADYSASGETYYERSIATGPMWNVGATVSFTNRF